MARVKGILRGLKAAAKGFVTEEPLVYRSANKIVTCAHCGGLRFFKRKASMNTAGSSLIGTEWLDKEACALICGQCTQIVWFYDDLVGADE
jgi:hypothetical protein